MSDPFIHHHKRKVHTSSNIFSVSKSKKIVDFLIYPVGIISLIMSIPQLYAIYTAPDVNGASFVSWATWTLVSLFWALYGYLHKEKPLFFIHLAWFCINGATALGIFLRS